jgi:hypothetical protein
MSFVKEISINNKKKITAEEKIAAEDKRQHALEVDSKMVTGIFKNLEAKGGDLEFSYRMYKEDPFRVYHFFDGKEYTIPLGVAKHINTMTAVPEREYAKGPDGTPQLYTIIKSKRQRYQFLSREFM